MQRNQVVAAIGPVIGIMTMTIIMSVTITTRVAIEIMNSIGIKIMKTALRIVATEISPIILMRYPNLQLMRDGPLYKGGDASIIDTILSLLKILFLMLVISEH